MNRVNDLDRRYRDEYPVFEKLFKMSDSELKVKLKEIIGNKVPKLIFDKFSTTEKVIKNEMPYQIEISYHDAIEITPFGISFKPKLGALSVIVDGLKNFVL